MAGLRFFFFLMLFPALVTAQLVVPDEPACFLGCDRKGMTIGDKEKCTYKKVSQFIAKKLEYPKTAFNKELSGKVHLSFTIEADGTATNGKIISSTDSLFNEEALRLPQLFPAWTPAKKDGKAIPVDYQIKVYFVYELPKKVKENSKTDARHQLSKQRIEELKDGVLVLRLATNKLKIGALRDLVAKGSVEKRPEFQAKLDKTIFERDSINKELVKHFSDPQIFDFCPVYVMLDTDTDTYAKGTASGYFLGPDLEVDPSISISDKKSFLTYLGTTPVSEDAIATYTALVIKDRFLSPLSPPFPAYTTFRKKMFKQTHKKYERKYFFVDIPIKDAVDKLNQTLHSFYGETRIWEIHDIPIFYRYGG